MLLVISDLLAHYSAPNDPDGPGDIRGFPAALSIFLRRLGNLLATANAIWIFVVCLFQFGGFFDRCWCDSSVL
jgi:hypothetical protein